jgi:hypothetical protein
MRLHRQGQWFSISPENLYFSSCARGANFTDAQHSILIIYVEYEFILTPRDHAVCGHLLAVIEGSNPAGA